MGVGCIAIMVALPVGYLVVRRIFGPIRELVAATRRIATGDLDAHVAVDRRDVIGVLARSFNQMVWQVRRHQQELADVNHDLERKVHERTGPA